MNKEPLQGLSKNIHTLSLLTKIQRSVVSMTALKANLYFPHPRFYIRDVNFATTPVNEGWDRLYGCTRAAQEFVFIDCPQP